MNKVDMIQNKVAESGIITLDIEKMMPSDKEVKVFDIAPFLFKGLILKEKDFRDALKEYDFEIYRDNYVAVYCSTDALIPMWAYMLIMTYLTGVCKKAFFGNQEEVKKQITKERIESLSVEEYNDARVVIKGCGSTSSVEDFYLLISQKLLPHVKSLMFGEPCSTVPIYKRKKQLT